LIKIIALGSEERDLDRLKLLNINSSPVINLIHAIAISFLLSVSRSGRNRPQMAILMGKGAKKTKGR